MRMSPRIIDRSLSCALTLAGCWLAYELVRQNGRILQRLEALEAQPGQLETCTTRPPLHALVSDCLAIGAPAPDFSLPGLNGSILSLAAYRGRRILLAFVDPEWRSCTLLIPALERIQQEDTCLQVLMVSRGTLAANQAMLAAHNIAFPVVRQRHWEISRRYATFAIPAGYLIDELGVIASRVATSHEAILALAQP
jgi:peroxiredoxin